MTVEPERFVVLLARQRTGTNALQSVLERHPALDCGSREIFHPLPERHAHLDEDRNWFRFLQRRGGEAISETLTQRDGKERAFAEFLAHLLTLATKPLLVLDVKLNSTHQLDGPWRAPLDHPALIGFLQRHRFRTLHLQRRNHLRTWVSLAMANQTDEWMRTEADGAADTEPLRVALDPAQLLRTFERWANEDAFVLARFPAGDRCLRLEYEELFPQLDVGAAPEQLTRIANWLGIEDAFGQAEPAYSKQSTRPLEEAISNYDEVAAALRESEFAACLDDEPAYRA